MPVRRFNGTTDEIQCSIGGSNLTEAITIAVFARPMAADEGTFIGCWDATTERVAFGVNTNQKPRFKIGGTAISGNELTETIPKEEWGIWVTTKTAGTTEPRWHHYGATTKVWGHANDTSTLGNPLTQILGTVRFGQGTTLSALQVDLAAAAVWTKVLSDAEIETLVSLGTLAAWNTLSPKGLWLFSQKSVETTLPDTTGNGANQSARTGTTVVEEEPPIPYEAYNDSGAGTITLSGTAAEAFIVSDSGSGAMTLAGTGVESLVYSDSGSGTLALTGSGVEQWEPGKEEPTGGGMTAFLSRRTRILNLL
jgi:hypothetical protein